MSRLILGSDWVSLDEPCFSLREQILQSPGSKGLRRYLIVHVIRQGDKITEFRRDLGAAKKFKATEFVIPGGVKNEQGRIEIVETVGRLLDLADEMRGTHLTRQPERERPNLIDEYREQPERRALWRKKRSMVGPLVTIQRG